MTREGCLLYTSFATAFLNSIMSMWHTVEKEIQSHLSMYLYCISKGKYFARRNVIDCSFLVYLITIMLVFIYVCVDQYFSMLFEGKTI